MSEKDLDLSQFKNVHWKAQDSDSSSLLFMKVGRSSLDGVLKHLSGAKFKQCLVNSISNFELDNVTGISHDEWVNLREKALDFFHPVSPKLRLIGVTGTNGKTTVCDLVRQICLQNDLRVRTIGTLGIFDGEEKLNDLSLTTPDYVDIRKALGKFEGVACLEMSSHALDQGRFGSLKFDCAAWTSFSQDHLDYHSSMQDYFEAKMKILDYLKSDSKLLIPSTQDQLVQKINSKMKKTIEPKRIQGGFFKPQYNQENLGLAIGLLNELGLKLNLPKDLAPPPGRFNIWERDDLKIIVDFAHTPGSLESITQSIKDTFPDHRLITVFGCGGNRDKSKRALMGQAASRLSDFIVLTSDNPRLENPSAIIADIEKGISIDFFSIEDRAEAIKFAFEKFGSEKSVILIAGKGHEDYIDQNGIKRPYSDVSTVEDLLKGLI